MMHLLACFQCELIVAFMKELSSLTNHHLVGKPVATRVIGFDVLFFFFLSSLLSSACALRPFKISCIEGRYAGCTVIQRCLTQEQERDPVEFFSGSPHPSLCKSFCFSLNSSFGEAVIFLICPEGGAVYNSQLSKGCLFAARTKASC